MEELRRIREALNLTQAQMADRLGIHQTSVSRMERGDLPVDKRTLLAAQALETAHNGSAAA